MAWIIRFILAGLGLFIFAHPAHAESTPLKDSLRWGLPLVAAEQFDLQTSLAWSRRPSNCTEGNLSRRNADGTVNGWKALADDAAQIAMMTSLLYLTKKMEWKKAEVFVKGMVVGRSGVYGWEAIRSLRDCR